ncbi:MAG: glycosyltransferase [Lachnospiraceae bacterium]
MKIAVLTYGSAPVPATQGGAVENLIEDLLDENEVKQNLKFTVYGIYDKSAYIKSQKYEHSNFEFVKCPWGIDFIDKFIYLIAKYILKKSNLISYRFIFRRLFIMSHYPKKLVKNDYDRIMLVANSTLFLLFKNKKLYTKYCDKVIFYLHNEVKSLFGCEKEVESIRTLIGVSQFVNSAFQNIVPSISTERCYVLKNCIDTKNFIENDEKRNSVLRKKYNISKSDFVLVFIGRIVKEKGILEVIEAVKKVNRQNIKLLVVGSSFYSSDVMTCPRFLYQSQC